MGGSPAETSAPKTVLALVGHNYVVDTLDNNDPEVRRLAELEGLKIVSWSEFQKSLPRGPHDTDTGLAKAIVGLITCAHAPVDSKLLDVIPNCRVVSNYGVGLDHTPDVLSDATCDMVWALLTAAARRVVEPDAFARGPAYKVYENMALLGSALKSPNELLVFA